LAENRLNSMLRGIRTTSAHRGEFIVVGLGRFGSSLAHTLVDMGYEVLGIDSDPARVQEHSDALTHTVQADSTNINALRQLGVGDALTVAVCIGSDIEASVLTTAALSDLEIPNIWAKAITGSHGRILTRVGAHHVVFPEAEMGARVANLISGDVLEYVALDGDFVLVETLVPKSLAGMALGTTNLRRDHNVTVVCIKPEKGVFTYAESSTVLGPNDLIVLGGRGADIDRYRAFNKP